MSQRTAGNQVITVSWKISLWGTSWGPGENLLTRIQMCSHSCGAHSVWDTQALDTLSKVWWVIYKEAQVLLRICKRRNLILAESIKARPLGCISCDLKVEQKLDKIGRAHFRQRKQHMQRYTGETSLCYEKLHEKLVTKGQSDKRCSVELTWLDVCKVKDPGI